MMGWACVFVDPLGRRLGVLSGGRPSWLPEEREPASAFVGECLALVAALRTCGTVLRRMHVVICVDCTAAMDIAAGRAAGLGDGIASILRSVSSFARATADRPPAFRHVRGHQGYLFNEVADVVAKAAARGRHHGGWPEREGIAPQCQWWDSGGRALDWAGLIYQSLHSQPSMPRCDGPMTPCEDSAGLSPLQCIEPFLPFRTEPVRASSAAGTIQLTLATYNVLSLSGSSFSDNRHAGLAFAPARPAILASALHACGVEVAGMQETRTEKGTLHTDGFLRYCSGADKGQFGVELWFNTNCRAIARDDGPEDVASFAPSAFTVLHTDPRRILVLFSTANFRVLFGSLHAPHRGAEAPVLAAWWAETKRLLEKFASKGVMYLLGDFNAAVGSLTSLCWGPCCRCAR